MLFKCLDCGYIFDEPTVVQENHGFYDGYEEFEYCPNCGGDFQEAADCNICGDSFEVDELCEGFCDECLKKSIDPAKFFEFCKDNSKEHLIEEFVMCYILNCDEVPRYPSYEFTELMKKVFEAKAKEFAIAETESDLIKNCIDYIMNDADNSGKEKYADWLNKREVTK